MGLQLTRRRLLLAGGGGVLGLGVAAAGGIAVIEAGLVPGRSVLDHKLGRCDALVPAAQLRADPGPTVFGSFVSARRRRTVDFAIAYPPGAAPGARLPVCLALHGFGSTAKATIGCGNYPQYLAGAVRAGGTPFALAAVDGGNGYWHPHPTDDPLGMIFDEFLPLLAGRGLSVDTVAVMGWSMGGYGALMCALTQPTRLRAVVASSPAVFHSFADAHRVSAGAFDSADEWARYDVAAQAAALGRVPLRMDIGAADPFAPAVLALREKLPDRSAVHVATGCHDGRFWESVAPTQIQMIGTALALG